MLELPPAPIRALVAISGPPGAGKSTLAEALVARLNRDTAQAALAPMDGFHLDNILLRERGLESRKGSPETFDAVGFIRFVERLGAEPHVVLPTFDRARDIAVAGAAEIDSEERIAVVEGNYLLLQDPPWDRLAPLWDLSIFLDVPDEELERRLIRRWRDHGCDEVAAKTRAQSNDMPNARRVVSGSAGADIVIRSVSGP